MQTALCAVIIALFPILKEYAGLRKEKVKEMADLVHRDELKQTLLDLLSYSAIVKYALEKAPAVDAVPVVRCKDCDFYGKNGRCTKSGLYTSGSDYCSYGERKTDG